MSGSTGATDWPVPRTRSAPGAGEGLLHPAPLLAVGMLLLNDHVLKSAAPGLVTGKLSDVAGLLFFPLLLVAVVEVAAGLAGRWQGPSTRAVTAAVAATGLTFAAVKLTPVGEAAYEAALGLLQWPFGAVADLVAGRPMGPPHRVDLTPDPTDLLALAVLWVPLTIGHRRATPATGSAARLRAYDLAVAVLGLALLAGATVDGWAHTHQRLALEEILTPWHAVVYVAFLLAAAVLLGPPVVAALSGRAAHAAIPRGYGASVLGVVLFAGIGLADVGWHVAFGIEADAEALLSPTHLGLGGAAMLIALGPLRAAWLAGHDEPAPADWPSFLPAALSLVAVTGIAAFALHVANLFVDPWPRYPYAVTDLHWYGPHIGVAAAVVQTVVLMVPALLVVRRWPSPPPGTLTLLVGGTTAGLTFLHDQATLVGAPVLGGFLADLVLLALRPVTGRGRTLAFGAAVPASVFFAAFVVLDATGPVAWSAHLIGGTVALAGATGLALAALVSSDPPRS